MSETVTRLRKAVLERALHGAGRSKGDTRRAAFDNHEVPGPARPLVDKVAQNAWLVTEDDVATVKAAGVSEDEIFELVVCTALGVSTRQLESALAALDEATAQDPKTAKGGAA